MDLTYVGVLAGVIVWLTALFLRGHEGSLTCKSVLQLWGLLMLFAGIGFATEYIWTCGECIPPLFIDYKGVP